MLAVWPGWLQVKANSQDCAAADQFSTQLVGLGHLGYAGAVERQELQDPSGAANGGLVLRLSLQRRALLEDLCLALGVTAGELWHSSMQTGGVRDIRQIGHLALNTTPEGPSIPESAQDRSSTTGAQNRFVNLSATAP